jgi:hypothetical protein
MDVKYSPIYLLRSYVWAVLKANTDMKESDYGGLVPIVPLAEQPELTQYSRPFITYGYTLSATGRLPAIKRGSMSFVVYSANFGELTKVTNIIEHALGRTDESARDVNYYKATQAGVFQGIRFAEIHTSLVEGGSPPVTEGGRQSAVVNVSFTYFIDVDVNTISPPFTGTVFPAP